MRKIPRRLEFTLQSAFYLEELICHVLPTPEKRWEIKGHSCQCHVYQHLWSSDLCIWVCVRGKRGERRTLLGGSPVMSNGGASLTFSQPLGSNYNPHFKEENPSTLNFQEVTLDELEQTCLG